MKITNIIVQELELETQSPDITMKQYLDKFLILLDVTMAEIRNVKAPVVNLKQEEVPSTQVITQILKIIIFYFKGLILSSFENSEGKLREKFK